MKKEMTSLNGFVDSKASTQPSDGKPSLANIEPNDKKVTEAEP